MRDTVRFYELRRRAAALLFPNRCPFCGDLISANSYYCELCRKYLPYVYGKVEPPENVSRLTAVCWYSRRARGAVLSLKYGGLIYPADAFALMMSEKLRRDRDTADVLVPVPSGFLSVKKRGFSTARVICARMALRLNIPMADIVGAYDCKAEQKALSAKSRRENAMKGFYVKKNADVKGKRIMLVDDVCTTGSTLSAIARMLLDAGAAEVTACVFAQTARCIHSDNGIMRVKLGKRRGIPLKYGKAAEKFEVNND